MTMINGMNVIRSMVSPSTVGKMEKQAGTAPNFDADKLLAANGGIANSAMTAAADRLSLSPTALKTLEFLNNQSQGDTDDTDDTGDLGDFGNVQSLKQKGERLSAILQMKMQSFDGKLLGKMQAAGVNTSQEMRLQDFGVMGILETSGHPDAAKIKQLFEQEDGQTGDSVSGFREISQLAELIRGLEQLPQDVTAGTMSLNTIAAKYAQQSTSQPSFIHTIGGTNSGTNR